MTKQSDESRMAQLKARQKHGFVDTGSIQGAPQGGGALGGDPSQGGAPPPGGDPSQGGAPGGDPSMGGAPPPGGGNDAISASLAQLQQQMTQMQAGGGMGGGAGGGAGGLKPKIDVNVVLVQILKILARIADGLHIQIPASEMVVTSPDLNSMAAQTAQGQANPGMDGQSAIQPIQPLQGASPMGGPGIGGGGGPAGGGGGGDPSGGMGKSSQVGYSGRAIGPNDPLMKRADSYGGDLANRASELLRKARGGEAA